MNLTVDSLTDADATALWAAFGDAIGREALRAAYGAYWPRQPVAGEDVWLFRDAADPVAWVSLRRDPVEPWAWFTMGVWPTWQRQQVAARVREWAATLAFERWSVDGLVMEVLDTNHSFQVTQLRRAQAGTVPWRPAGRVEIPGAEAQLFWWANQADGSHKGRYGHEGN
jgi:hypothetical protein